MADLRMSGRSQHGVFEGDEIPGPLDRGRLRVSNLQARSTNTQLAPGVCSTRKMYGALQQRMEKLIERMENRLPAKSRTRRSLERLRHFQWSADIAALGVIINEFPGLVEEYLSLMACTLHEFPDQEMTTKPSRRAKRVTALG